MEKDVKGLCHILLVLVRDISFGRQAREVRREKAG